MGNLTTVRILVDTSLNQGIGEYQNFGDVAMLQMAVMRLFELFPSASIEVLTESPSNLKKYCPGATPLSRRCRDLWVGESFLYGRLHNYFSKHLKYSLERSTCALEENFPALLRYGVGVRLNIRDDEKIKEEMLTFLEALENIDLLLVCGAGGFADGTRNWDLPILGLLETAVRRRIPTVMMGQGIGPLNDLVVLERMKKIFPFLNLITLRGGRGGLSLLESLGVPKNRLITTGDEAIELAYKARRDEIGNGLGINLRVAPYAGVGMDSIDLIRPALQEFAHHHNAPMIPVPIAFHRMAADHETIQLLMANYKERMDCGPNLDTPLDVIRQAGRCRMVVTGAYHAAVFALAQGIPVVCMANSHYYLGKYLGLQDMFEAGCEVVMLSDPDVAEKLTAAMERTWQSAESVRKHLQMAALRQIESTRNAYKALTSLVKSDYLMQQGRGINE